VMQNMHLKETVSMEHLIKHEPCDDVDCQECCDHELEEHYMCIYCGYQEDIGYIADLLEYQYGEDR